ncbi:hypothetical protein EDB85DRAFT_1890121 [Lactarius pseudohatsudake]|nr:hypothetical protein EDB85DRAFT_1890121 [Lactarius pseudohatsudake]
MSTPPLLQGLTFDLQSINDLAFDEDCEIFLQLGLLAFLAAFIWFMNSKRSWQEIFETLNGSLSVLSEVIAEPPPFVFVQTYYIHRDTDIRSHAIITFVQHFSSTRRGVIDLANCNHVKISMGLQIGPLRSMSPPVYPPPPPGHGDPPGPPPHLHPGSGPCGLTAHEWHGFLIFVILLMLVFLIAVVVAWYHDEGISEMWLRAKHRVQVVRTGTPFAAGVSGSWHDELLKHVLPQHDIESDRLITPGPGIGARAHPAVNFILTSLFPSMRHQPGPS